VIAVLIVLAGFLVYATEGTKAREAVAAIESLTKEPVVGDTFTGKVVKSTQFGAFVELM
jgi:polyribonucleotide nucleotidyltransferase